MPYNVISAFFKKKELEVKEQPTPKWHEEDFTVKMAFKLGHLCVSIHEIKECIQK